MRVIDIPTGKDRTPPIRPPDLHGQYGNAWRLDIPAIRASRGLDDTSDATVCAWLVYAPHSHPLFKHYHVTAMHLRPLERDGRPLIIHLEGATHEVWVHSLHPGMDPAQILKDGGCPQLVMGVLTNTFLSPTNYVGQVISTDDDIKAKIVIDVLSIVDGRLNPDSDGARQWIERYGNHCLASVVPRG